MDFVETDVMLKERDDERDQKDQSVPQAEPEAGDVAIRRSSANVRIWSSGTTAHHQEHGNEQQNRDEFLQVIHEISPWSFLRQETGGQDIRNHADWRSQISCPPRCDEL